MSLTSSVNHVFPATGIQIGRDRGACVVGTGTVCKNNPLHGSVCYAIQFYLLAAHRKEGMVLVGEQWLCLPYIPFM